nr:hypothetical protein [Hyphomonas sp. Mor2]
MDTRAFRSTLETHGIDREVSDAIVDLVEDSREPFVTNEKLELEMTKQAAALNLSFAGLETRFEAHKTHTTRLVLGTSGALGLLMIMLRFLPT